MQSPKKHTNRLIDETSPYLLQHAHNPVDWYPWSDEAFEKAEAEDKPVLVSIGYSACHWCHVMEHESFEDEATARIMNDHFVNIKVDMEERPDVDQIYMNFVQLTTGSGGWPLNVFLTPDRIPFFGGTYFPPQRRFNMPSFQQVLNGVAEAWSDRREELLRSANDVLGEIRRIGLAEFSAEDLEQDILHTVFENFVQSFDSANGGFGGAPKFPASMSLEFLLRYFKRTGNKKALDMVIKTCVEMARGGIYDQIGGGFHRYSVDAVWLVPHFEKMLYDNAQLARLYLHVYQITKDEFFKDIAVETLDYVKREMTGEQGGFYSTQDADSEGVEGKFFVWKPGEVEKILGAEDARFFNFYYDISQDGNFEGENILNVKNTITETAQVLKIPENELLQILRRGRKRLFEEREKRIKPFRDEKILTAWNGLMLATFAEASAVLDRSDYLDVAVSNADFIVRNLNQNGKLLRTWKDGKAKLNAYLEDYANFADGLLELFQVTGKIEYLEEAKRLTDLMIEDFWDPDAGGFYFTSNDHEKMVVRSKDYYDNATPSGNSAAADLLLKLSAILGNEKYENFAVTVLRLISPQIKRYPQAFGKTLSVMELYFGKTREIVIVGENAEDLINTVWSEYLPNKVLVLSRMPDKDSNFIPLLREKRAIDNQPTAYVCENFVCRQPAVSSDDLKAQLDT